MLTGFCYICYHCPSVSYMITAENHVSTRSLFHNVFCNNLFLIILFKVVFSDSNNSQIRINNEGILI